MAKFCCSAVVLAVLQQWCGINVIFNYAQEIFAAAGYQVSDILFNIVITGAVNVAFTLVALAAIDRYGRRFLLLTGTSGLLSSTRCSAALPLAPAGQTYVGAGACGHRLLCHVAGAGNLGSDCGDLSQPHSRQRRVRSAVTALWTACFLLTYTFPLLNAALGPAGTFWTYAAVCLAGLLFLFLRLPETKGKTLEEIETDFRT